MEKQAQLLWKGNELMLKLELPRATEWVKASAILLLPLVSGLVSAAIVAAAAVTRSHLHSLSRCEPRPCVHRAHRVSATHFAAAAVAVAAHNPSRRPSTASFCADARARETATPRKARIPRRQQRAA